MSTPDISNADAIRELRFALAEGDTEVAPDGLRARVIDAATAVRPAGRYALTGDRISGLAVFERTVVQLDLLLGDLDSSDWSRPALRHLDVQGLVGHLVGVEDSFLATLGGVAEPLDHIASTQPTALAQGDRLPEATHRDWADATARTISAIAGRDLSEPFTFYGVTLPLDEVLVVRAFEMWIHDEDIRRAVDRQLVSPDPERLDRMAALAVGLIPAGVSRAETALSGRAVRLVLTGPGGGTWNVALDGTDDGAGPDTRVVVDVAAFCRVIGNRDDLVGSGAIVSGDPAVALALFAGAAALALD